MNCVIEPTNYENELIINVGVEDCINGKCIFENDENYIDQFIEILDQIDPELYDDYEVISDNQIMIYSNLIDDFKCELLDYIMEYDHNIIPFKEELFLEDIGF